MSYDLGQMMQQGGEVLGCRGWLAVAVAKKI